MEIGAILTKAEADLVRERLKKVSRLSNDRRIREQVRMALCTVNKAERRIKNKQGAKRMSGDTQGWH